MRILYLCHRIPYPPDKGDKIRAFHQVRAIAARHEVDLFTLADEALAPAHRSALLDHCHTLTVARLNPRFARLRALPFLLTRAPLTVPYFYSAELQREVREALSRRSYDRVFVYCSAMAQYVESVHEIPVITDFVDVDSDKWKQYAAFTTLPFSAIYRRDWRTLREFERRVCERSSSIVVTTEREARLVRELSDRARVHVIPNGVDTGYFKPSGPPPDPASPAISFTGDMSYFPNEEAVTFFARKVLPLIHESLPAAGFLIIGRNPTRNVQKLAGIEGVEVTGSVPDVRTYLARSHVSVAPFSIAAGIQNKILEAMAYGLPVVGTSRAVQGLSADARRAVDIADTPEEMAATIVGLIRDPQLAHSRGMEGRLRIAREYDWEQSLGRLLQLLEDPAGLEVSRAATHSPVS
jgi:sugar transferase (PEP-CTERM/EpsH1 system associated)